MDEQTFQAPLPLAPVDLFSPFGFVNRYDESGVYVWLKFISIAAEIEEVKPDFVIGEEPDWLREELSNLGWSHIVFEQFEPHDEDLGDERRLLQHGLAPEQPFLVHVTKPKYRRIETMDGVEWDCDIDGEVVAVQPWSPEEACRAYMMEFERCGLDRRYEFLEDILNKEQSCSTPKAS